MNMNKIMTPGELAKTLKITTDQLLDIGILMEEGRRMDAIRLLRQYTGNFSDIGEGAKVISLIYNTLR